LSIEDVLKQLQRLQWEIYEAIKPGVVTAEALREATEALKQAADAARTAAEQLARLRLSRRLRFAGIGPRLVPRSVEATQTDPAKLKATVTQAEKDRVVTGTVTAEQADPAKLKATVTQASLKRVLQYPEGTDIDPRNIRGLTSADVVTVIQQAKDRVITQLPKEGTIKPFSVTLTAEGTETVLTPSAGKAAKVTAWNYMVDADVIAELRFATSGNLIGGIPTRGINAMNLVGKEAPTGAADEPVEIYLSGAATAKGWLCYEEV